MLRTFSRGREKIVLFESKPSLEGPKELEVNQLSRGISRRMVGAVQKSSYTFHFNSRYGQSYWLNFCDFVFVWLDYAPSSEPHLQQT